MVFARAGSSAVLLFLAVLVVSPDVAAAGGVVTGGAIFIKGGAMRLQKDTQVFDESPPPTLITVDLDDVSYKTINLGWEIRFRHGWSVGTEYLGYRHRFAPPASPSAQGTAVTKTLMVSGRKYFLDSGHFHPYVGGGVGIGETDISNNRNGGSIDRLDTALFLHAVLGVELRVNNMSLMLEARHLSFNRDNSYDVEYDPTATGVLLGVGLNW